MIEVPEHPLPTATSGQSAKAEALTRDIQDQIGRLSRFSTRGIQAFSLFMLVSLLAWWNFPLLPSPEKVIAALGRPPASRMISLVLVLYTFFAVILSLLRMTAGIEHRSSFCHV